MKAYQLTATIWREAEGYVSECPELGVGSCGDTPEEALANLKEAAELYLENALKLGMLQGRRRFAASPKAKSTRRVEAHT